MKQGVIFIALALLSQTLFAIDEVSEKGFLRVAVYKDFAPFSFRENKSLVGIDVELGKLLAKKLNATL